MTRRLSLATRYALSVATIGSLVAFATPPAIVSRGGNAPGRRDTPNPEQVLHGRFLVLTHAGGNCHGGGTNPAATGWLAGMRTPQEEFLIGPCGTKPADTTCYRTRPRNLTPDNTTGMGRFSERQIFNALRYGLRPGETPDVEITAATPGRATFRRTPSTERPRCRGRPGATCPTRTSGRSRRT